MDVFARNSRVAIGVALPVLAGAGLPAMCLAQAPPKVISVPLDQAASQYRLVPIGRVQPDTTSWTVRYLPGPRSGLGLQVMIATSHGQTTVDSVLFDRATLLPMWERAHGASPMDVAYSRSRVHGRVGGAESVMHRVSVRAPGYAYSSTMDNIVVRALPLSDGYRLALPFWDGDHVEMDTVKVRPTDSIDARTDSAASWTVDFIEPYATETLWIDRTSRRIVKHIYTWARDRTQSEVVAMP